MLLAGLAGSGKNESISSLLKNPDGEVKQNGDIVTIVQQYGIPCMYKGPPATPAPPVYFI
jgi:hypothetical protein